MHAAWRGGERDLILIPAGFRAHDSPGLSHTAGITMHDVTRAHVLPARILLSRHLRALERRKVKLSESRSHPHIRIHTCSHGRGCTSSGVRERQQRLSLWPPTRKPMSLTVVFFLLFARHYLARLLSHTASLFCTPLCVQLP